MPLKHLLHMLHAAHLELSVQVRWLRYFQDSVAPYQDAWRHLQESRQERELVVTAIICWVFDQSTSCSHPDVSTVILDGCM
jgi:hypothetical protein